LFWFPPLAFGLPLGSAGLPLLIPTHGKLEIGAFAL
jgi:hypothetical protein